MKLTKLLFYQQKNAFDIRELERPIATYPDQKNENVETLYLLGTHYYKTIGLLDYEKSYSNFDQLILKYLDSKYSPYALGGEIFRARVPQLSRVD